MPRFLYRAKQGPHKTVEGELVADTRTAAVSSLDAMGLSAVWIREDDRPPAKGRRWAQWPVGRRGVSVFTRQLASLMKSGVPILRALSTVAEQTEHAGLRRVIDDLRNAIRDGGMLSDALVRHPGLFSDLYVNMVRAGESAGALDTVLFRLAEAREREDDLRRRVQAAIAYPALVAVVGLGTLFVLLAFFLPRVAGLFDGYRRLPLPTRLLIGVSAFVSEYWYWFVALTVLAVAVFHRLAAAEKGRALIDRIALHIPMLGGFVRYSDISRFARTLALVLEAGIPIDNALALSAKALRNAVLRDEIEGVREATVRQGVRVSEGLRKARHFPVMLANMSAVGEEGGRLDEVLSEVATFYEKELDLHTRLATSLLEPVLILVVGALVGFVVAAMLLPIFELGAGLD